MTEAYRLSPLNVTPGIKRDGTSTEGNFWNEGLWSRFYRGLPRSILGYRSMTPDYPEVSRGLLVNLNGTGFLDIFSGSASYLSVGQFTTDGFGSGVSDRTPSGFPADPLNVWQFDTLYDGTGGGLTSLVAHAAPNLGDIANNVNAPVYYGDITSASVLVAAQDDSATDFEVSGGVVTVGPYAVAYGNNGLIAWSDVNDPSLFPVANQANPTATKVVKGMSLRGTSAPAALFWSLTSVIQMTFTGGDTTWSFTTLTDQSSILSSSSVVEFDGVYYWTGVDRFLVFNGTLRELPNEMNLDFFFTNLNFNQRQKVFGYKIPRWGEIWWCFPTGESLECNHAVIYNVRENTWYDTPLPTDGRSAAYFAQSWLYPVLFGANTYQGAYQLYQHEYGNDEIINTQVNAIPSFIISSDVSIISGVLPASQPRWTQLVHFEPDFLYGASMTIDILTRQFAQDTDIVAQTNTIAQGDNYFATQVQGRYIRWKFGSNVQNGYYIMGTPLVAFRDGDQTP